VRDERVLAGSPSCPRNAVGRRASFAGFPSIKPVTGFSNDIAVTETETAPRLIDLMALFFYSDK